MNPNHRIVRRALTLSVAAALGVPLFASVSALTASATTAVPRPSHVVVVVEENHSYSDIIGNSDAPFINALASDGASFTQSFGVTHPSQPNYLALFSGSTQGVTDDSCPIDLTSDNLASQLLNAGLTFTGYSEGLPSAGFTGCGSGAYARKHNPWADFASTPAAANLGFDAFPTDFSQLPAVSFVMPNLNDDMHDGTVAAGDSWLNTNLSAYATWAAQNNSLLIVTWDEDDNSANNQIPTIIAGAGVQPGQYAEPINHYNVLRTIEDAFDLPSLGNAATAQPITDIWTASPPPPPPPPPPPTVIVSDAFNRTVASGWGAADVGGPWTSSWSGTAANLSVSPGAGSLTTPAQGKSTGARLGAVASTDADLTATFALSKLPTGSSVVLYLVGRRVAANSEYRERVTVSPSGSVALALTKLDGSGSDVVLRNAGTIAGLSYHAGSQLDLHMHTAGTSPTTVQANVWLAGTAEPPIWQANLTDASASLQAAGAIAVATYAGAVTNLPLAVSVANLAATTPAAPATTGPTAAFTATANGLTVNADASGSTDSGGTITSYSWDFGDGSPAASGSSASYTYAAAGTYTITLTVTDSQSLTASATHAVSVAPIPPPPTAYATDGFARVVAKGWGSADLGGAWGLIGSTSAFSVSGNAGRITIAKAGASYTAYLAGVSSTNTRTTISVSLDKPQTGGGTYVSVLGRRIATSDYRVKLHVVTRGAVSAVLERVQGSTETTLASSTIAGLTYTSGQVLQVQLDVTGTSPTKLAATVWARGATQPAPQLTATDATAALQQPGGVGVLAYLSGTATNAPEVASFSNLWAGPPA